MRGVQVWEERMIQRVCRLLEAARHRRNVAELIVEALASEMPIGGARVLDDARVPVEGAVTIGRGDEAVAVRPRVGFDFDDHEVAVLRALDAPVTEALRRIGCA